MERGVLLHRTLRIGDRGEHEIFLSSLRVFVQPVEITVGIGRLRVERRVLADLFQQLVEDRPGFVHLAVSHKFVAQVYPVPERSWVGNHHQRVPVDIHFVQVAALAAQRGVVLEIAVVGLVVDVINVITAPEIEMLIIHSEGKYDAFKRSGKKPSDFCKTDLRMHDVKSYDFVKDYFSNQQVLINAIKEYRRTANVPKGEYSLSDLLK